MARYRKVDPRIWNDEKFVAMSERGKLVFLFVLTHPLITSLGAMRATLPGLAAELGMELEAFREAFREALSKGMVEHDPKSSFVGLPKFLRYNPPESPNVVLSWGKALDFIPECDLKGATVQRAKEFSEDLPEAFRKAFRKAFPEAYRQRSRNPEPEQEQEPEQEPEKTPRPPKGETERSEITIPGSLDCPEFRAAWADWIQHRKERKPKLTPTAARHSLAALEEMGTARAIAAIRFSISKGWQGIFEDKNRGQTNGRPRTTYVEQPGLAAFANSDAEENAA